MNACSRQQKNNDSACSMQEDALNYKGKGKMYVTDSMCKIDGKDPMKFVNKASRREHSFG